MSAILNLTFEPIFESKLIHISIFLSFRVPCQTVALINLSVASNAALGTIIETKCGLAETEFRGKVELNFKVFPWHFLKFKAFDFCIFSIISGSWVSLILLPRFVWI